ncbi:enoyl-CoA hydratase/isomerase family protein [Hoeflea ulvae]|uniref:Enoyl-CoA hydratase-related protein n=1 Tax=Hoeflea ulvae TaxID=2983764 RepID=A0ABT3YFQ3_9HYPH|nr:enoyl-CoA hydratase-related protein [Hoeflea ulvae]MCY0094711.1 enoyl-CoA hydratase-related protein [Hoeflea ulvae]
MTQLPVLVDVADGVARITLNRPDRGNALNQAMADALLEAALRTANDGGVRCVVLTGAGRMFCVGGDVTDFAGNSAGIGAFLQRLAGTLHQAMTVFASMNKPMICLVNGPAAGAGLSMAISGDIVLADPSAHFTAAYLGIGLTPDGGMTWLLPRLVGLRQAQDIILTNRRVEANEAAAIGLVTRVVEENALAREGSELATRLASGAVASMGAARKLLQESFASGLASQMDRELTAIAFAGESAEGREGVRAFLERRPPAFRNDP